MKVLDPGYANASVADLIVRETMLTALGMGRWTYMGGYAIPKPDGSPRLLWHYTWFARDELSAFAEAPP